MIKQKLVTLIAPSLVLDEFRRLGWVCPSRLSGSNLREHVVWPQVGGGWALDRA
jgi:hypothetical protein